MDTLFPRELLPWEITDVLGLRWTPRKRLLGHATYVYSRYKDTYTSPKRNSEGRIPGYPKEPVGGEDPVRLEIDPTPVSEDGSEV